MEESNTPNIPVFYKENNEWVKKDYIPPDPALGHESGSGGEWTMVEADDYFDVYIDGVMQEKKEFKLHHVIM